MFRVVGWVVAIRPYNEKCIFLHEKSPNCKSGVECEFLLCMFKHEINLENIDIEESNQEILKVKEPSECIDDNDVIMDRTLEFQTALFLPISKWNFVER